MKSVAVAVEQYSVVVGGVSATSLANVDVLLAPDGVSLPATFLQAQGQLTQAQIIYAYLFG